jgi:hypothetical protein
MIYLKLDKEHNSFMELLNILYDRTCSSTSLCPTYTDKECTEVECYESRMRSFQALFEIARTYYPTITINEFYEYLLKKELKYWVCDDIKKVVFHYKGGFELSQTVNSFLETLDENYDFDESNVIENLKIFIEENS